MKKYLGCVIALHFLVHAASASIELLLKDGNLILANSSFKQDTLVMSLSSQGKMHSEIVMSSLILSESEEQVKLIHQQNGITIEPELRASQVGFNDYYNDEYWLVLRYPLKQSKQPFESDINFVGLSVFNAQEQHKYLLPAFSQPFSFLPINSLWRCEDAIVSIRQGLNIIDISVFSREDWKLSAHCNWEWRSENNRGLTVGRCTTLDEKSEISLSFGKNWCVIWPFEQRAREFISSHQQYSFRQILEKLPPLQSKMRNDNLQL